ncbi:MAG: hypothetical protein Q8S13_00505, partial [Dehalococcoidia bacterium]|nr:hypothetical protein [Dehalococcoidia bacterium]
FEHSILVSRMTTGFVDEILASGRCARPTLEEWGVAHRFVLSELQPHFNKQLGTGDRCPVT